jgi:hypothetical protein
MPLLPLIMAIVPILAHDGGDQASTTPEVLERASEMVAAPASPSPSSIDETPRDDYLLRDPPETAKSFGMGFSLSLGPGDSSDIRFLGLPWNMRDIRKYWEIRSRSREPKVPLPYNNITYDRQKDELLTYYRDSSGGWSGHDFDLLPAEALLIRLRNSSSRPIHGTHVNTSLKLLPAPGGNWISLPYHGKAENVGDLFKESKAISAVALWDADEKRFDMYPRSVGKRTLKTLSLVPGMGCVIFVDEPTEWTPAHY